MLISEVSKKFSLTVETLRYYERIGLIPPIQRNKSGIREFTEEDCDWVLFVKNMRKAGIPIETLIDYVNMVEQGKDTIPERKKLLIEQQEIITENIIEMQLILERLNEKINNYEEKMLEYEEKMRLRKKFKNNDN